MEMGGVLSQFLAGLREFISPLVLSPFAFELTFCRCPQPLDTPRCVHHARRHCSVCMRTGGACCLRGRGNTTLGPASASPSPSPRLTSHLGLQLTPADSQEVESGK